ncbi:MAG TPA: hypothetical protein VGB30_02265 [bacterium]
MNEPHKNPIPGLHIFFLWLLVTLIYLAASYISFTVMAEDSYISFRYAENIAAGYGPVFNAGGEAVEGFSNPLWVGILAVVSKMQVDVPMGARYIGVFFAAMCILELMLIGSKYSQSGVQIFLLGTIAAIYPPLLFWGQGGLENGLYLYLMLGGVRRLIDEIDNGDLIPISAIFFMLLALTRPEGVMFYVLALGIFIYSQSKVKSKRVSSRIAFYIVAILPFFVYLVWRESTFGEFVPNTFYAKVNNGLRHKAGVGFLYWLGWLLNVRLVVALAFYFMFERTYSRRFTPLSIKIFDIFVFFQWLFILYAGGDIHPYDRFTLPIYLLLLVYMVGLISQHRKSGFLNFVTVVVLATFLAANAIYHYPADDNYPGRGLYPDNALINNAAGLMRGGYSPDEIRNGYFSPRYDALDIVGMDLKDDPSVPEGLLATDQCGKIPYRSGRPTLDLFGLNDPVVARIIHSNQTWDKYATEILNRQPETFVVFYRDGGLISRYYLENTVLSKPFLDRYQPDVLYEITYHYTDIKNNEQTFTHELLRFGIAPDSDLYGTPLSDSEIEWLRTYQPITYVGGISIGRIVVDLLDEESADVRTFDVYLN